MRKKLLVIALVLCLAITAVALVACNKDNTPPEGGAWNAKCEVWTGATGTLTFTSQTEWKLEVNGLGTQSSWNPWQSGTYSFDGQPGKSTLRMTATKQSENTFIKGKAVGEEATFEPTDGIYTLVFSINGSDKSFAFKPPVDGSKPGNTPAHVCAHVCPVCQKCTDANCNDAVCADKCQGHESAEKTEIVTLNATDAVTTYAAAIKVYSDGTFDFELASEKVFGGTWASSDTTGQNAMADVIATPDATGAAVVGNSVTISITPAQDYSSMTYTCHVDYVVPETITMSFDFTGTLVISSQPEPEQKVLVVTLNATDAATTYPAAIKVYADGTFDFELASEKVFGGTWASSDTTGQNPMADVIATPDATGAAVVGNSVTISITPAQDYSSMTYTCHVDYVVPETITMSFDFTGTLNLA